VDELNDLVVLGDNRVMSPHSRSTRQAQVVEPPHDLDEMMRLANFLEQHSAPAALLGPDGEQVPLPLPVYEALKRVVDAMERGASVSLEPIDRQLTTQQAASLLGVSRNTLVRLLDEHELPFERLGETRHRRLRLHDVLAYRDRKREERRSRLDEMTRQANDDGLYDADASDYAEALRRARRQ
jgi:excisionase family DNA binding protein